MNSLKRENTELRRLKRKHVSWQAQIELGQCIIAGVVKDYHEEGVCFEPEIGYFDGKFVHDPRALVLAVRHNDSINVEVQDVSKKYVVRWTGRSQTHQCCAIGLERKED